MDLTASVSNKSLTGEISPLGATLTKKWGGVHPSSQKPISLPKLFSSAPYLVTSLLPYFARRSWRGRMLGQRAKMEVELSSGRCRLSDYFDEVASGALLRKQGEDGLIHRGEL